MIQTSYDPQADAMSLWFAPPGITAASTREVAPGVMLDVDRDGQVIGVEVLGVRQRRHGTKPALARSAAE